MSNMLSDLLTVADNNAFSNLYDIQIGKTSVFKLRVENIQVDGYSLDYKLNESTKQYMLTKVTRPRSIQLSIRESSNYSFLRYLNEWLVNFYNPESNVFMAGAENSKPFINDKESLIQRKRPIEIKAWGNDVTKSITDDSTPALTLKATGAMLEKCPSISLAWADSKPIVYQVSFVCEKIDYSFGKETLASIGAYK